MSDPKDPVFRMDPSTFRVQEPPRAEHADVPGETDTATDLAADPECDFAATDFHDLARQLEGAGVARGEWQPQPRGKLGKL